MKKLLSIWACMMLSSCSLLPSLPKLSDTSQGDMTKVGVNTNLQQGDNSLYRKNIDIGEKEGIILETKAGIIVVHGAKDSPFDIYYYDSISNWLPLINSTLLFLLVILLLLKKSNKRENKS